MATATSIPDVLEPERVHQLDETVSRAQAAARAFRAIGGQETALFLGRGEAIVRALDLHRRLRLDVVPISIALPWGLDVGDIFGHVPLPAKIAIDVLEPIDVAASFGDDLDAAYDAITGRMQTALDALAARRRWPIIG